MAASQSAAVRQGFPWEFKMPAKKEPRGHTALRRSRNCRRPACLLWALMGAEIRKRWDLDSKALGFEEKAAAADLSLGCGQFRPECWAEFLGFGSRK